MISNLCEMSWISVWTFPQTRLPDGLLSMWRRTGKSSEKLSKLCTGIHCLPHTKYMVSTSRCSAVCCWK